MISERIMRPGDFMRKWAGKCIKPVLINVERYRAFKSTWSLGNTLLWWFSCHHFVDN